jgi:Zn-dependent peptidase ImmA (M78 family)
MKVSVEPGLLRWAGKRAGTTLAALAERFPLLSAWERGDAQPTLKQLESFAQATHTPIGYFFLREPPIEDLPIPDCRTMGSSFLRRPSADLLDTIYLCQQRQEWFRDYARTEGLPTLTFVGSATPGSEVVATAAEMRSALRFDLGLRQRTPSWREALRQFISLADELGILVMVSGVVGSNGHRKLDPEEFRGFALADPVAPLVFVNGADTKAAQMFTLAHELAHIWLGKTALSDFQPISISHDLVESWCNRVAAELLVPLEAIRREYRPRSPIRDEMKRLAKVFKVSTLVILRRIFDAGGLTREELAEAYHAELSLLLSWQKKASGGDFCSTLPIRTSRRLAHAMVRSALEGRASFSEVTRLLGFRKMSAFRELSQRFGFES